MRLEWMVGMLLCVPAVAQTPFWGGGTITVGNGWGQSGTMKVLSSIGASATGVLSSGALEAAMGFLYWVGHPLPLGADTKRRYREIRIWQQRRELVVEGKMLPLAPLSLRLFTLTGAEVQRWRVWGKGRQQTIRLPLPPLTAGIYVMTIATPQWQWNALLTILP